MKGICILIERSERKRASGRHRLGWEDNVEMNHKETWHEDVDWI
jgi:hypothetical protein